MTLIKNLKLRLLCFSLLFTFNLNVLAQSAGENIFKTKCASCHTIGQGKFIGPDLQGVTERRTQEWLISWITDNKAFRESGDKDAIAIYEEYNRSEMTPFYFSEQEMSDVLSYLADPPVQTKSELDALDSGINNAQEDDGMSANTILIIISIVLLALILILISAKNSLKVGLSQPAESVSDTINNFLSVTRNKVVIGFLFLIFFLKFAFNVMMGIGVVEEYQPAQPINFSHKIHAGDNEIDCNYCHSSARNSKTAGVPSANVCMNCHETIRKGTETGETEIKKIHDAITNNTPIEWVRVHQLPDLSYFNHSQHVNVANLECQQCHGNMEEKTL